MWFIQIRIIKSCFRRKLYERYTIEVDLKKYQFAVKT